MPELPDITVYLEALEARIFGETLLGIRLASPFLLRTVDPPLSAFTNKRVTQLRRIGKRIAIGFEADLWLVLHLMIAGRLHWKKPGAKLGGRQQLAAFDFETGALILTEAGTQKRASLSAAAGGQALRALDPGGMDVMGSTLEAFRAALRRENHTIKRSLTDPKVFSGIGNAYSDEILWRARVSPIVLTQKMTDDEIERVWQATKDTLTDWIARLRADAKGDFPEGVTAFRDGMAVHGRFNEPCPACGAKVQRIRYAANETNYCARCQTGGRVLADRSLSRLLGADWPRNIDEL